VPFAHESERQFASLLDFYDVEWIYEPHEFAVEWDDDGQATKFFRPDFYLPGENVYIEITTMNQKLVTKKNKKVRKFREIYPGTNIKIFYQRDYLNLLVKYGLADVTSEDETAAPTRIPGPPHVIDLGTRIPGPPQVIDLGEDAARDAAG
jgi:hypothetical protein